jgi:hypothetical protein
MLTILLCAHQTLPLTDSGWLSFTPFRQGPRSM